MDAATLRLILLVAGAAFLLALYLWERARAGNPDDGYWDDERPRGKREPSLNAAQRSPRGTQQPPTGAERAVARGQGLEAERPAMASDEDADIELRADRDEEVPWDWGEVSPGRRSDLAGAVSDETEAPAPAGDEQPVDEESRDAAEPLLVQLFVVSTGEPFPGKRIAAAATQLKLEVGSMDIFHRRVSDDGGALFSMANLVQPGSFPLDEMDQFESPGLALFAQLRGEPSDLMVFDEMLHAARSLADELGGEVQERNRAPLTEEQARVLRARVSERIQLDTGAEPEG
jgi:cell division protein ZipA